MHLLTPNITKLLLSTYNVHLEQTIWLIQGTVILRKIILKLNSRTYIQKNCLVYRCFHLLPIPGLQPESVHLSLKNFLKASYTHPQVVHDDLPHNHDCSGSMKYSQVPITQTCKSLNLQGTDYPAHRIKILLFSWLYKSFYHLTLKSKDQCFQQIYVKKTWKYHQIKA